MMKKLFTKEISRDAKRRAETSNGIECDALLHPYFTLMSVTLWVIQQKQTPERNGYTTSHIFTYKSFHSGVRFCRITLTVIESYIKVK